MRFGVLLLATMLATGAVQAATPQAPLVDPAYLATIRDDFPPLPRSATPAERLRFPDGAKVPDGLRVPPAGPVRAQAEYEANDGLLVRWGTFNALLTEMAVAVTTLTADARMYVVVTGASQQASATTTLSGAGVNMSRVTFITQPCSGTQCSVWMRDYGPRFIDDGGLRGMVDHTYNRPARVVDDAFPDLLASQWAEPSYDLPLVHGGGNFHLFSTRKAFMTELIVNENAGVTPQQVRDHYRNYQGLDLTLVTPFPASFDATQHIDMWIYPVDGDEVIVGQYPASVGSPASIANDFATARAAEGYTVRRTPGWNVGSTHFTYTNAVVLNEIVMVCRFNDGQTPSGTGAENTQALNVFQQAFPGRTVVPVDCSTIISSAGAIHCIVMHVPRMLPDTATAVSVTPNPAVFGQSVTAIAAVSTDTGTPAGQAAFTAGNRVLGTATLSGGTASVSSSQISVGTHPVLAAYEGSLAHAASTSNTVSLLVQPASTTASVNGAGTTVYGQMATFVANISPVAPGGGVPTGTVTFFDGASTLGTATLVNGSASLSRSLLAVGSHSISAVYNGGANHTGSTSTAVTHQVQRASTQVTLTVSPSTTTVEGTPLTATASIAVVAPGVSSVQGTVTFELDGVVVGSATVSGGQASLPIGTPSGGPHTLRANYEGSDRLMPDDATQSLQISGDALFSDGYE